LPEIIQRSSRSQSPGIAFASRDFIYPIAPFTITRAPSLAITAAIWRGRNLMIIVIAASTCLVKLVS
jgi:hypothetical protein